MKAATRFSFWPKLAVRRLPHGALNSLNTRHVGRGSILASDDVRSAQTLEIANHASQQAEELLGLQFCEAVERLAIPFEKRGTGMR